MNRRTLLGLLLVAMAFSCTSEQSLPAQLLEEIANEDPAFAGQPFLEHWLAKNPRLVWSEKSDAANRQTALASYLDPEHEQAVLRAQQLVPDEKLAREALAFLRSASGQVAVRAERLALVGFPPGGASLADGVLQTLCDPDRVGPTARARFEQVEQQMVQGATSHSPQKLSWVVAAMVVEPEHAKDIRHFYESEAGKRWLAIRQVAQNGSQVSLRRITDKLEVDGFASSAFELLDTILPRDESGR